jgi:hypothetical protein
MYYKLKAMSRLFSDSKSNELRSMLIYDAMTPEFKAANAELLKAIKMNDKSDALPYTDLGAINKAMKANDGAKVGEGLKKVQLKLKDAEKKLNEDLNEAMQKFSESQKLVEADKEKAKQAKATQQLFAKVKTLAEGLKTSPKNASKLTSITDKLNQYGDLSGKVQKVIQLTSKGKDASKQIEMLEKAVEVAEKKFNKAIAASGKELKKNADGFAALKDRVKICKDKLAAFQKERLYIANVVKQMPQGDLRHKGESESADNKTNTKEKKTTASFVKGKTGKIGYGAYLSIDGNKISVEVKPGFPMPYILDKGIWMEKQIVGAWQYIPEGDPRFKPKGASAYLVWGKRQKSIT